ncbi:endonuclease NucS domain-containing protein [Leeuwenhoekiella sp. LLG6367-2.1]|uniref:endonuclease NucS domain-containing protein n=1 Tax=Leeuwenhoekiella sp. LLG6367-2.1 TaxID=3160833 RepID=UPI0038674FE8
MSKSDNFQDEVGLQNFYKKAIVAYEHPTPDNAQEAYDALMDMQTQMIDEDPKRFEEVFQLLPNSFVEIYAEQVIKDIQEAPLMYLLSHNTFFMFFTEAQYSYLREQLKGYADNTTAYNFIRGIDYLLDESYEIALHYFKTVENTLGDYYLAVCYYNLSNYQNAIRLFQTVLTDIQGVQKNVPQLNEDTDLRLLSYDLCQYILSAAVSIGEYETAEENGDVLLTLFDLESLVAITESYTAKIDDKTDFDIWVNNYTVALDKQTKYKKAGKFLERVQKLRPNSILIKSLLNSVLGKINRQETANTILVPILHKKRAFGINDFVSANRLALEKNLEDLIELQIKYGMQVFGKDLEVYQDNASYGKQYTNPNIQGVIDLLLINLKTDTLYVVELKRNDAGVEVYEQVKRYMTGLKESTNKKIKGIICLHKATENLIDLVKTDDDISLFTYHFEFKNLG